MKISGERLDSIVGTAVSVLTVRVHPIDPYNFLLTLPFQKHSWSIKKLFYKLNEQTKYNEPSFTTDGSNCGITMYHYDCYIPSYRFF